MTTLCSDRSAGGGPAVTERPTVNPGPPGAPQKEIPMHPETKRLSMQLAAAFGQVAADCIPAIEKYMRDSEDPREVSFGARVRFWTDKEDRLRAQLVPKSPKLSTVDLENYDFTLAWQSGQITFDFVGVPVPAEPAAASEPTSQEAMAAPEAVEQKPGNGSNSPKQEENLPPLPEMVGHCSAVRATGDHDWRPIDDQPGMMFCMCGARGRMNQEARQGGAS